jgi:DNA-binding LacI/PurR family transcriptional regulator
VQSHSGRPTIRDVAQLAGVSTATVSYVMNKTRAVSSETEEKVRLAIEALSYLPNAHARELAVLAQTKRQSDSS